MGLREDVGVRVWKKINIWLTPHHEINPEVEEIMLRVNRWSITGVVLPLAART